MKPRHPNPAATEHPRAAGGPTTVAAGDTGDDPRLAAAERLLRERGLEGARVSAAGPRREIAAVEAPVELAGELAAAAPELKALGFLYVTLDLAAAAAGAADEAARPARRRPSRDTR